MNDPAQMADDHLAATAERDDRAQETDRRERIEAIRARHAATTRGPWQWFGDTATWQAYLATVNRGRIFIMRFYRWGMQSAQPAFQSDHRMVNASELARFEVQPDATSKDDPRLYRHDFVGIRHPDAIFLASSWADVELLLAEVDRLRALLPEGT
jgi:hypothetical protein